MADPSSSEGGNAEPKGYRRWIRQGKCILARQLDTCIPGGVQRDEREPLISSWMLWTVFALLVVGALTLRSVPTRYRPIVVVGLFGLVVAWHTTRRMDSVIDRFQRNRALGSAPELMAYAILSLRTTPSLESAADLAARRTGGFLGASLRRHRTAAPDGREAWESFAAEFQNLDDSLTRSVSLMVAGIETPETGREAVLERALSTALDGASTRVSSFVASIRGPTMGIYAFGVMLPLALVGMLPVVTTTGSGVP
ncbi:MAG: hypothetical protein ABEJ27_03720, partial [Halodesulfurarchaeum sp.]